MKKEKPTYIRVGIYCLLALTLWVGSLARYAHQVPVRSLAEKNQTSQGNPKEEKLDIGGTHEAVMSFLQVEFSQEYSIQKHTFCFFPITNISDNNLSAKPLSTYFLKLFAKAIAINAP